jgi:hypothetical protein
MSTGRQSENIPISPVSRRFTIPASPSQVFTRLFTGFQRTSMPFSGQQSAGQRAVGGSQQASGIEFLSIAAKKQSIPR